MQILLSQPKKPLVYHAGQYVEFLLPDEDPRPFSIANAPNDQLIEFHVRHAPENLFTTKLIQQIRDTQKLALGNPIGNMRYHPKPSYPLIFLAAGTGLAPCKAMIEEALRNKNHQDIYLYWGVRYQADLYWHEELSRLRDQIKNFHYIPILSSEGRVYDAALKDHKNFSDKHIYASGPAEMVFATQKALSTQGLNPTYFYSDWVDLLPQQYR